MVKHGYAFKPDTSEPYWQKKWEMGGIYKPDLDRAKRPFYNLMMFPYPSAEGLHVGNMYAFTGADIYGRFKRMQGFDVFEPIGLDGFGIHSENYAIQIGRHPKVQAKISEKQFYRQLHATGNAYDWSRTVETYDPDYYKWTQWIFIQLFKAGLAYRKKAPVNFCPSCKTVLADEQVIKGRCERCEAVVEKRQLEQWFFKITAYADRLLEGLDKIDWTEKVKIAQRQWIGKSVGTIIRFVIPSEIEGSHTPEAVERDSSATPQNDNQGLHSQNDNVRAIEVFTTRADTLYGATFIVLAPEHELVQGLLEGKFSLARSHLARLKEYVERVKKKTEQERITEGKEKTGVFTGLYAINPLNQEKLPVWIADYALMSYGTGALFGDAHDERDTVFAKKYGIPLKPTIVTGDKKQDKRIMSLEECFTGYGTLVNSGDFSGLTSEEAKKKITAWLSKKGAGGPKTTYHLRDWLISRQRYWGPPIPMVFCEKCDWQPVPEKDLPVLLPDVKDWKPKGIHSTSSGQAVKSPLASVESFVNTTCPNCGRKAVRETDVSDTFLDSSWYFLRYTSTEFTNKPWDEKRVKKWLPVSMYIGGAEHSVLHLLYTRFLWKVFYDLGYFDFSSKGRPASGWDEPFTRFFAHGLLIKEGAKMSKSRGNIVVPDVYIKRYGADTLRTYLMFLGPFSQGGDFYDRSIAGANRFLQRVNLLFTRCIEHFDKLSAKENLARLEDKNEASDKTLEVKLNQTIRKVSEDMEGLRFNTAIAALMELLNTFQRYQNMIKSKHIEQFLLMLAPFAPHLAEHLYQMLRIKDKGLRIKNSSFIIHHSSFKSIHLQPWPTYDPKLLEQQEVTIVVQVDGKVRDQLKIKNEKVKMKNEIEKLAKDSEKVKKHIDAKEIKKVVYVEGKIINFVTE